VRRASVVLDPLAWALALAAFFDGVSDNWVHAALLATAAGAVWYDHWQRVSGGPRHPSVPLLRNDSALIGPARTRVVGVVLALAAVYCVVVGAWALYTWPTTVAVAVPAAVWLALAWRGPLRARPVPAAVSRRTAVLWGAVVVAAGSWELLALFEQPNLRDGSYDHPTLSYLMDTVLASHAGRTVTLALWLLLGYALLNGAPWAPERTRSEAGVPVAREATS
jgi:hypothetical protein